MKYYEDGTAVANVVDTSEISAQSWTLLDATIIWSIDAGESAIIFRINRIDSLATDIGSFPIIDSKTSIHLLGAE